MKKKELGQEELEQEELELSLPFGLSVKSILFFYFQVFLSSIIIFIIVRSILNLFL